MDYDYRTIVGRLLADGDVDAAAASFVAPVRSADDPEAVLWVAWEAVASAAAAGDPVARERLVALVAAVQCSDDERTVWGLRLFADLPVLGAQLREEWNRTPAEGRPVDEWTGLNAFAAGLSVSVGDYLLLGLWTVATALETFAEPRDHVPAAAAWFELAGPQLASATLHGRTYAARLGELASSAGVAEGGFSVPRWTFWRSRLEALAREGDESARRGFQAIKKYDRKIAGRL